MNEGQRDRLLSSADRFPPPQGVRLSYGTAGFREDASLLLSTVYRVGILAALRSLKTEAVIGLMITASHNKVSDNGVKIADQSGGMLTQEWEPFADDLANVSSSQDLVRLICEFAEKEKIVLDGSKSAKILVARDTRPSGELLLDAAKHGIGSILGAVAHDMGILTTPQLHWMVQIQNKGLGESLERDYFSKLSGSFRCLLNLSPNNGALNGWDNKLVVDGANGVGGQKLELLKEKLSDLAIEVRNSGKGEGVLNEEVGADFVQKEKIVPRNFGSEDVGIRCASFDGDADRLVYFTVPSESSNKINLVDGDKILSLFAIFIKEQLTILEARSEATEIDFRPRLGVIQTAYANGASTRYLKELGMEVVFTPTGVKYLHEKAAEFDIGIYFEANGHGTVLFSDYFSAMLDPIYVELSRVSDGSESHKAAFRLREVSNLINQAVGDALSGLLLVEAILQHKNWSIHKWSELYQDLPSRQLKVKVVDRTAVVTANAETEVVRPPGIQEAINSEIQKHTMKGGNGVVLVVLLGLAVRLAAAEDLKEECSNDFQKMVGCLDYATGKAVGPSKGCCDSIESIKEQNPKCLCFFIQQTNSGNPQIKGLGIQEMKLLQLPSVCQLKNSSVSYCPKLLGIPANSPDAAIFSNITSPTPAAAAAASPDGSSGTKLVVAHFPAGLMAVAIAVVFFTAFLPPFTAED